MNNRNLLRGLFLMAVALLFGGAALRYPSGSFAQGGPGLFPVLVSGLLLLVVLAMVVKSRFTAPEPMDWHYRNIVLIMAALCGFALVSQLVNMIAGIVFMVFCASLAGSSFSFWRSAKIAVALVLVALAFEKLLGLNLPLY